MNKKFFTLKKLFTAAACVSVMALSVLPSSALTYQSTGKDRINTNGYVVFHATNANGSAPAYCGLKNITKGTSQTISFAELATHPHSINLGTKDVYEPMLGVKLNSSSSWGGGRQFTYKKTAGTYEKVKIKLSDFSNYFKSDGSRNESTTGGLSHTYHFTSGIETDSNGSYASAVLFESGGAFTYAVPNKNGEVELYVKKELGAVTYFSTNFAYQVNGSMGSGGGRNHSELTGLMIGDLDADNDINIKDATEVQRKVAGLIDFDDIQMRNGDANLDGTLNIMDATQIQRYVAGII